MHTKNLHCQGLYFDTNKKKEKELLLLINIEIKQRATFKRNKIAQFVTDKNVENFITTSHSSRNITFKLSSDTYRR